jgi:AraC family transcriptional regulator of adaptative response / DNA-3-methyladenine glycosylase II
VAARPGLRVPGAWDAFELGVRAILGQQISVRGATTLAGRLVAAWGEPSGDAALPRLFPRPESLATARLESIGLPRGRAEALRAFAARGTLDGVRGVGPWTRAYVAMRSGDPDAFPAADLGVLRALGVDTPAQAERRAAPWRPWRAYAVLHLWMEPC